jgi:hypothetical protein
MPIIVKPKIDAESNYEYLAAAELDEFRAATCCIRKGIVTGIDTLNSVSLTIGTVDYSNIPVYIHTDVGARLSVIKSDINPDPLAYFKNAALMFPLPGGTPLGVLDDNLEYTTDPEVLVVVETTEEGQIIPLYVCGIIKTGLPNTSAPYPTYNAYIDMTIHIERTGVATGAVETIKVVYDLINNCIAQMPTETAGVLGLPFIDAAGIHTVGGSEPDIVRINSNLFTTGSETIFQPTELISSDTYGDPGSWTLDSTVESNPSDRFNNTITYTYSADAGYGGVKIDTHVAELISPYGPTGGGYWWDSKYETSITSLLSPLAPGSGIQGLVIEIKDRPMYGVFNTYVWQNSVAPGKIAPIHSLCYHPARFQGSTTIDFTNGFSFAMTSEGSFDQNWGFVSIRGTAATYPAGELLGFLHYYKNYNNTTYHFYEQASASIGGSSVSLSHEVNSHYDYVYTETEHHDYWILPTTYLREVDDTRYYYQRYVLGCIEDKNFICKLAMLAPITFPRLFEYIASAPESSVYPQEFTYDNLTYTDMDHFILGGAVITSPSLITTTDIVATIANKVTELVGSIPTYCTCHTTCEFVLAPVNLESEALR